MGQSLQIRSDKDSHFTGQITQNAQEAENLTGVAWNKVRVRGVMIASDQQLRFVLRFWRTDGFDDTNLDSDAFIGEIELDLVTFGRQIAGAGHWMMDLRGLSLDIQDEDATNEFHVSLQNLSATAKDPITDASMQGAVADDGGAQTDQTAEANSAAANDMTLLPAGPAVNDAYYFGGRGPFSTLTLNIGTAGAGDWTITWEYWNGSAWVALAGVTDNTTHFRAAAGNRTMVFTQPSDWVRSTIGGLTAFWIRGRVSAFVAVVTQPLGTQSWVQGSGEVVVEIAYEESL